MNIRSAFVVAILIFAAATFAEPPAESPPHGPPRFDIERLTVLLDLTEPQKTAVQTVLDQQRAAMEQVRAQAKASGERPTPDAMKAAHDTARKNMHEQLQPVLNELQLKKFDLLMQPPPHGPHHPPEG